MTNLYLERAPSLYDFQKNQNISTRLEFSLHLFYPGLSTRNVVKAMSFLIKVKKSHGASWKWIQQYNPQERSSIKGRFQNSS